MSGEQVELVDDGRSEAQLREAEYGGTPMSLIRQAFIRFRDHVPNGSWPRHFVEPGSGPAPFCRVVRELWPDSTRWAVDVRGDEKEHATRNATHFYPERFEDVWRADGFDLVATNPPFSCAFDWIDIGLSIARRVLFLMPDDWHKRTNDRVARFRPLASLLVWQWQIAGRIAFYGGSRTDRVSYSWWLFERAPLKLSSDATWPTELLPMLPPAQRRWQGCRPGEEP